MNRNPSVRDWQRLAADSQHDADRRRWERLEKAENRAWTEGFLVGCVITALLVIAWFYPLVNS